MIIHKKLEVRDVFHRILKLTKNNEFQLCIFKNNSNKFIRYVKNFSEDSRCVYKKKLHKFPSSDEGERTSCLI